MSLAGLRESHARGAGAHDASLVANDVLAPTGAVPLESLVTVPTARGQHAARRAREASVLPF
jgi:hypothetical protein